MARNTVRNALQAVAYARGKKSWGHNQCLNFVWYCFDYPNSANVGSAIAAWRLSLGKVTDGSCPPRGSIIYWSGPNPNGHVAVSDGAWYCYSTDVPMGRTDPYKDGGVSRISIADLERSWGLKRLGWTRYYVTVPIAFPAAPAPVPAPTGLSKAAILTLQQGLLKVFPDYAGPIKANGGPNGIYGPATTGVVKQFQSRCGLPQTGKIDTATRSKLASFGIRF